MATATTSSCKRCVESGCRLHYANDAVAWHPTRQTGRSVLGAHWVYSRSYAEYSAKHGLRVTGLRWWGWVPVAPTVRSRRRAGVALTIATDWLADNGVRPTRVERALCLPITYVVLPYTRNVAMAAGAVRGRRERVAP